MRIVLVVHGFPPDRLGGTELHTAALARNLAEAGHDIFVFAGNPCRPSEERRVRDRREGDVLVRTLDVPVDADFAMELGASWVRTEFERFLDEVGPDVVHVQHLLYLGLDLISASKDRGLPVVVTLHDFWLQCPRIHPAPKDRHPFRGSLWGLACAWHHEGAFFRHALGTLRRPGLGRTVGRHVDRARVARRQLELADRLIAPSEFVRERFLRFGVSPEKVVTIAHGVEVGRRREPAGPTDFGFVGSIAPAKGVHVLCEAFARVRGPSTLRIYGRSEDRDYLASLAPHFDSRIRYEGEFDPVDIDRVFDSFDVLVAPSLVEETLSMAVLEAQAFGRPVVASRIGAIPELVEHGRNGLLVPPGDARRLSEAIVRMQDASEVRRLQSAVERPASHRRYRRRMEAIYEALLPSREAANTRLLSCR